MVSLVSVKSRNLHIQAVAASLVEAITSLTKLLTCSFSRVAQRPGAALALGIGYFSAAVHHHRNRQALDSADRQYRVTYGGDLLVVHRGFFLQVGYVGAPRTTSCCAGSSDYRLRLPEPEAGWSARRERRWH